MRGSSMRGFVVLVVLLMLAVVSAVAVGQLAVVNSEAPISVRREEEAQARAIAEGCLLMLQRHAERFMDGADADSLPDFPPSRDFDLLLNPNGSTTRGSDEHLPAVAGGVRVTIPGNTLNPASSEHQWLMIRRGPAANQGACFVRYEDNSDDDLIGGTLPDSTTDCPTEGTGVDVNFCDRDGAIYLTAIGVYPATGNAQDIYGKAHARVTLRKLYQVATPGTFPAAITAGGDVDIKNNITICGVGGIQANDVNGKLRGSSCMCGSVETLVPTGSAPPLSSTCCPTCSPGVVQSGVTPPRPIDIDGNGVPAGPYADFTVESMPSSPIQPDLPTPGGGTYLANNGFGTPTSTTNIIGNTATCKIYLSNNSGMVFYWDASDTNAAVGTWPPVAPVGAPPATDCTTFNADPVPRPCVVDTLAGTIDCSGGRSLCWKPLAKLGDGPVTSALLPSELSDLLAVDALRIIAGTPPPFVEVATKKLADPVAADRLCGTMTTTSPAGFITHAGGNYTMLANASTSSVKDTLFIVDQDFTFAGPRAGSQAYMNVGVLAGGNVTVNNNWNLACPTCSVPTDLSLTSGGTGTCKIPVAGVTFAQQNQLALGAANRAIPGFVVKTDGTLNWASYTLVGLSQTDQPYTSNNGISPCFVGRFLLDNIFDGVNNANINVAGEWLVTGNIDGAANNIVMTGDVYTEGDAKFKNNWVMNGRVFANGNIEIKDNAQITFDGGGATGSFGSSALSSFMESQW